MLKLSHDRLYPSAKLDFGTIASSHGEFTVQFDTRTFLQQSMSMPSRSVSIFRLSMVRLSTPVTSRPKCPPFSSEKSRSTTLRQFFRLIVLLPTPACSAWNWGELPRPGRAPPNPPPPPAPPALPAAPAPPGATAPPGALAP